MPRFRPRISILTALLLMTIFGVTIVVIQLWREVDPLHAEVRRLRDEAGVLSIEDESKVYAMQVKSHEYFTWKWRVWIPRGSRYKLRYAGQDIPAKEFPPHAVLPRLDNSRMDLVGPEEHWIVFAVRKDQESGKWTSYLSTQQGSVTASEQNWVGKSRAGWSDGLTETTRLIEPGDSIELKRYRISKDDVHPVDDNPADGFLIWLEPVPVVQISMPRHPGGVGP